MIGASLRCFKRLIQKSNHPHQKHLDIWRRPLRSASACVTMLGNFPNNSQIYINAKINNGEQIEALGTLEEKLKVALNKASVLERTQLHKLQEMMIFNARSSTDENIKKMLKTAAVQVHIQRGALFRNPCKTATG